METDKMVPGFWADVHVGDIVQMKDEQALQDSLKRGDGLNPIDFVVGEIRESVEANGLCTWRLYRLDDPGQQTLWLLLKIVDEMMDVRVYYTPDEEYTPTNRMDLIDGGSGWLFDGTQGVPLGDAMFAPVVAYTETHEDGTVAELEYQRKNPTLSASMEIVPAPSGVEMPLMTLVTEYRTEQQCLNPELLILEVGGEDDPRGGLVYLYLGSPLMETDFDVLKR